MKKIYLFLFIVALTATSQFLKAQTKVAQPAWLLTGNSGTSLTTQFVGTTDNQGLVLRTYDSERVRIGAGGNVGIGTKTPKSKLQVDGGTPISLSSAGYFIIGNTNKYNMVMDYYSIQPRYNGAAEDLFLNGYGGTVYAGSSTASYYGLIGSGSGFGLYGSSNATAVYGNGGTYGINGFSSQGTGVYGSTTNGYGGYFYGTNGIGVEGYDDGAEFAAGVYGYVAGSGEGVDGYAYGSDGYGVYGYSAQDIGVYGSIGSSGSYAGYFDGSVYTTGTFTSSDEKLKQNITDMSSAMSIIGQLKSKTYNFRQDGSYKKMNLPQGQHYGLIAQDLEKVLPGLVKDSKFNVDKATHSPEKPLDSAHNAKNVRAVVARTGEVIDFKAVNYTELIPIIIKGMQEQQQTITDLQQTVQAQQQQINQLLALNAAAFKTTIGVSGALLLQNTPNPFTQTTTIHCTIPSSVLQAQLVVYSSTGIPLKSYSLSNKGANDVSISAGTLAAGQYIYTLIADGKTIDSKSMILTK